MTHEDVETLIIGAGQAGLATAYRLTRAGRDVLVVDAQERVGDGWRHQWDTLKLYSPARYDGLPGMAFPAPSWSFPGKDDVAMSSSPRGPSAGLRACRNSPTVSTR